MEAQEVMERPTVAMARARRMAFMFFRMLWVHVVPGWNQTINGCLLFGAMNVLLWSIILFFWRKAGFRYSLEYFWVKLFRRLGKQSTKMDFIL